MGEGGHGNMSPGQLSQVAGGRPLAHSVSGQLVHDRGHRWTSENNDGRKCLVEFDLFPGTTSKETA